MTASYVEVLVGVVMVASVLVGAVLYGIGRLIAWLIKNHWEI